MQLLLDDVRYRRIAQEAQRRGVSMALVIRDAIDRLPVANSARRSAIDAILSAPPMSVPMDPAELRLELDEARGRPVG